MKLLQTKEYLILIDEEAEIKEGDYYLDGTNSLFTPQHNFFAIKSFNKAIGYYPLNSEAKELDLPLLPPFEEDKYIKDLAQQRWGNVHRTGVLGFIEGYRAAQSKQFSLEDMIAFSEYVGSYYANIHKPVIPTEELLNKFIQSLSTQQLPKEFIPIVEYYIPWKTEWTEIYQTGKDKIIRLKTITNSEGKQEIQGTYKY